jgi:hypothetical protein
MFTFLNLIFLFDCLNEGEIWRYEFIEAKITDLNLSVYVFKTSLCYQIGDIIYILK